MLVNRRLGATLHPNKQSIKTTQIKPIGNYLNWDWQVVSCVSTECLYLGLIIHNCACMHYKDGSPELNWVGHECAPNHTPSIAHLCPDECLKAGLKVVDAAVVELGHLIQQLLVLRFKVLPDWSQLLPGLAGGKPKTSTKHTSSSLWSLSNHIPATFSGMSSVNNHEKQYENENVF